MGWASDFRADTRRYAATGEGGVRLLWSQGVWALLQYRLAHAVYLSHLPVVLKAPLWLLTGAWRKLIEITTGISLPRDASIGGGLYIGHFGGIIVHGSAVLGRGCNVSQGVTIGVSGHGEQRGVPVIGDNVGIAANAVVAGKIHIGDRVSVSACSLVTSDVPADCVVRGVPGIVIGTRHRDS